MFKNAKRHPGVADPIEYHKPQEFKRGDPKLAMTSTQLRSFASCPDKWMNGFEFEGSKSTDFGGLLDCRLLTPEFFDKRYVVSPATYPANARSTAVVAGDCSVGDEIPWDGKATYCKNWKKEQGEDLEIISDAELKDCDLAIARLMSKPTIKTFLECSDRQVLCTAEWHDEDTGLVIPVKILLDLVPRADTEFGNNLGDFKTTRNAALVPFMQDAFKMGYHVQAALYRDVFNAAENGGDEEQFSSPEESYIKRRFCWLICENIHPFQPGKRLMTQNFYDIGRAAYRRMLKNYCQCLKYNRWPDYDETDEAVGDWSLVDATPFMAEREMFSPKYNFEPPKVTTETVDVLP